MPKADFHFYGELNDFLRSPHRQVKFSHFFKERGSIKDMIEALGVPHPEVGRIEVNGECVDFFYIVSDGDSIKVYPFDSTVTPIFRPRHLPSRFVLDIHLGKLATSLRLLGFDTLYRNDYSDPELAEISATQERILLTRDRGLLMRSLVTYGYYVRETNPERQVIEVLRRFDLFNWVAPFKRCLRCNGLLEPVGKSLIDQLPEKTQLHMDEFHRCSECGQVYWKGSHYKRMQNFINRVLEQKLV